MALCADISASLVHSAVSCSSSVAGTLWPALHGRCLSVSSAELIEKVRLWRRNAVRIKRLETEKDKQLQKTLLDVWREEDRDESEESEENEESEEDSGDVSADEEFIDMADLIAERAQRVEALCAKLRGTDSNVTFDDLSSLYEFRLDRFQRLAIEGFLKGCSIVVCAPTSSGKTLIAEAAGAATLARSKRMVYTTPLKALSNQKYREFRSVFGEENVGLLTGDISINRDAPIVVMTAEILRNMFYLSISSEDELEHIEAVVLDEIHYMNDPIRGTVWEEMVVHCPKRIKLICLSATIANPEELAGWIGKVHGRTELIISSKRPVPLTWHLSSRSDMLPLLDESGEGMNRELLFRIRHLERIRNGSMGDQDQLQGIKNFKVPRLEDTLDQMFEQDMLPAIWFTLSRKGCDRAVESLQDAKLLTGEEFQQVFMAIEIFRKQHPDAIRESAIGALYHGVAAHHAGCLPLWKSFIEELFQRGLLKVVFATETLAAGINMPAKTTVLPSFTRTWKINGNTVLQMAGRAGRRGMDVEGHVIIMQTPFRGPEDCYKMACTKPDRLVSQFTATYGMVLSLLQDEEATENSDSNKKLAEARNLVEKSFASYLVNGYLTEAKARKNELEAEIASLESGQPPNSSSCYFEDTLKNYQKLLEKLEAKESEERELRLKVEEIRLSAVQNQLEGLLKEELPYVSLSIENVETGRRQMTFAAVVGMTTEGPATNSKEAALYLALGCDNFWYRFPAQVVTKVYRSELDLEHQDSLKDCLTDGLIGWKEIGRENVSYLQNSFPCRCNLPPAEQLTECELPQEFHAAKKQLNKQQRRLEKLNARLDNYDENEIENIQMKVDRTRKDKISRLESKLARIDEGIASVQPSGWSEFLKLRDILITAGAMREGGHQLSPLGEMARAIRGANELWLAIALQDEALTTLQLAELAAAVSTLVTDGKRAKAESASSERYEASAAVVEWIEKTESRRLWLQKVQEDHDVYLACDLAPDLAGFVEAWVSGVSWKELEIADVIDEGDFARLLRRTIDLLFQIPHLPHVNNQLRANARQAAKVMDRPPISEVVDN